MAQGIVTHRYSACALNFIKDEDPEQAARDIVNIVKNRIPKAYGYSTNDIQVLAPMQRSVVGATNLNIALQEAINPVGDSLLRGGFRYRRGDRVMQIRNNDACLRHHHP